MNAPLNNDSKRTKCEIWTRVMGYHRPVSHFNPGKREEFKSRTFYDLNVSENSSFMEEFGK